MTREITKTTVKVAKMEIQEGNPVAVALPDEVFIGNISQQRAQRMIDKIHTGATVLEVQPDTKTYEMPVEQFLEQATVKEPKEEE